MSEELMSGKEIRAALASSDLSVRLLAYAALEDTWWANVGRKTLTALCRDLREAAAALKARAGE